MGFILSSIQWFAGWFALAILALCIASGLYLACDIAEENPGQTRKFLSCSIIGVNALYLLLCIDSDVPVTRCILGIACHLAYLPLLRTFPVLDVFTLPSALALGATVFNHFMWFRYFMSMMSEIGLGHRVSPMGMLGFFLILVWLVPMGFFVSLTSADECLPGGGGVLGQGNPNLNGAFSGGGKKKGIFKSLMDMLLQRKEEVVSSIAPGMGKHY